MNSWLGSIDMAPDRVGIDAASAGWIGAGIGALSLFGGAVEWARRRFGMIDKRWADRAAEIEARVEAETNGQHTARIGVKTELETRMSRLEASTHDSILRLHVRMDGLAAKDDTRRIEEKLDRLLVERFGASLGGKS